MQRYMFDLCALYRCIRNRLGLYAKIQIIFLGQYTRVGVTFYARMSYSHKKEVADVQRKLRTFQNAKS